MFYECQYCKKMVEVGDVLWLDDGTILFCPLCDEQTIIRLFTGLPKAAKLVPVEEEKDAGLI